MYPELTPPLLVALGVAAAVLVFLVVRRPVLRRLSLRQIFRRPTEAALVVLGSMLGTTLIVASLVVGDSLDRSVRQAAYDVLGPIDETVLTTSPAVGDRAAARLERLRGDPRVDGVLRVRGDQAAFVRAEVGGRSTAEPRGLIWEVDFAAAGRFGAPHPSGLSGATPGPGEIVINRNLADSLGARPGDRLTVFLYGHPAVLSVTRVVPATGLAGMGVGATVNRDGFVRPGTLGAAARAAGRAPFTAVLVSNRGGVIEGNRLTAPVAAEIHRLLGPLVAGGADVSTPKKEVLDAAKQSGDALGSLFLFIASFSIIAGVLLLVNIFVMLAEERRGQLGILRAIGMRRRRVTAGFAIEGACYGAAAALLGAALGVGVGRVVVVIALKVLNSFNSGDNKIAIAFAVRRTSLVNGLAAGYLIAFLAVVLTSIRIARQNIIAAIRDLEPSRDRRPRRRLTVLSAVATVLLTALAVPAVAASTGAATYLLPALAAVAAVPMLRVVLSAKTVTTVVALAVLAWGLLAHIVRPHVYDDSSTATYIVLGTMLSFAAVVLLSQYQGLLLRPLRPLIERPSERGLALRLAVAYPTARRFRTGATLAMYCIVVLVIVLLTQISAVIDAGVGNAVASASRGWTLRADISRSTPLTAPDRQLTSGSYAGRVVAAAPMLTATARGTDPLGRRKEPFPVLAIGVPPQLRSAGPVLDDRLARLGSDAAVWDLVQQDARYAIVDAVYGATGGPPGQGVQAGDTIVLTDPRTGTKNPVVVAGVMRDGTAFYNVDPGEYRYPVLMGARPVRTLFGDEARTTSVLLRTAPGVDVAAVIRQMQAEFLANGLVATDIPQTVRHSFAASTQLFRLMQGYLALGLLVGITGLGVVMVRAVRERRRTIGVLRALGFRAATVRGAFLVESTFIALEGVAVGTGLGVLITWLLYTNSPSFGSLESSFPIAWAQISVTVGAALVASLLATVPPARRAAQIRPALAVRVAE